MASYISVIEKESRPYLESLRDDMAARKDPSFFWPTGTQVYVGRQGSGKTISAVYHAHKLKERYPALVIVTNLLLTRMSPVHFKTKEELRQAIANLDPQKEYIYFQDMAELALALVEVNNGRLGVLYLIDEIHTYFNALDSKNIPMFVFTEISQQRKQRKAIIGTSQLFMRMAKPFREQCDNIIMCSTLFGIITVQRAYDGMTLEQDYDGSLTGHKRKTGWFFHNRKRRDMYDTYQKVVSGAEQYDQAIVNQINISKRDINKLKK